MKKQAVVLIHGIGEQIPMDTLRGFVDVVWKKDHAVHGEAEPYGSMTWSKPDQASGDFELRRVTTPKNREGRRTDFFEFYWAHLMEGTELSHLLAWARVLLFRPPSRVPQQLRGLWYFLVALTVLIVAGVVALNVFADSIPVWGKVVLSVGGGVLWAGIGKVVLTKVAGDAARYLHVAPPNIESRRAIREAGIKLLEQLDASGKFDRIIVVGHSLGTVIGYDILTHYWARCHDSFPKGTVQSDAQMEALAALEELARDPAKIANDVAAWQDAQGVYSRELRAGKHPWLVTDFITMGSPLAHAELLMARTPHELNVKKAEREFPTCPPVLEDVWVDGTKVQKFTFKPADLWVPHHGAVFGPTRWTNLYFECKQTVFGDVIGGPVQPAFGPGVRDIPLTTNLNGGLFSHTLYWTLPDESATPKPVWIEMLREAVRICETAAGPASKL